jgi:hypothetical protein
MAFAEQWINHPVAHMYARNVAAKKQQEAAQQPPPAAAPAPPPPPVAPPARKTSSTAPSGALADAPSLAAPLEESGRPRAPAPASGSQISLLVSIPLLCVNLYVELPPAFSKSEDLMSRFAAMQQSGCVRGADFYPLQKYTTRGNTGCACARLVAHVWLQRWLRPPPPPFGGLGVFALPDRVFGSLFSPDSSG